jgi:hypothetical protein
MLSPSAASHIANMSWSALILRWWPALAGSQDRFFQSRSLSEPSQPRCRPLLRYTSRPGRSISAVSMYGAVYREGAGMAFRC